jgi:hypothetical protein
MPTRFSDIVVDSVNHGYRIGDKNLVSVTTVLKSVIPEFDKDSISLKMAERSGVTQAEILRQWEAKGAKSRDKGTRLHQYIEDVMAGKVDPIMGRVNDRLPEMDAFDDAWTKLRAELDAKVVKQEFVVGDEELGVAGRVDSLISILPYKAKSRLACIFDWKTGSKFEVTNRYEKLLPPFHAYDNCKLNEYSIQLSLYRLIMERNKPDIQLSDGYILHLREDGTYQLHRARDFREEIAEWLKDGVPASVKGDPATEKRVQEIVKLLDTNIDRPFAKRLSDRGRRELGRAARTVLSVLNSVEDIDE